MKKLAVLLLALCAIQFAGCGPAPVEPTPTPRPATLTPRPTATHTSAPTATPEPSATPSGPVPVGTMLEPDITVQVTHATGIKVDSMHLGPNDELFFIDHHGDTIYQLLRDGRLAEHVRFQGYKMDHFNVAPDGTFWFNNNLDWTLYRVPKDGQPLAVAQRTNRTFCFDSQGNLSAVESDADGVQRISEDGVIEVVTSGLQGQSIIAGPDDALYLVTEKGELVRLGTDGARDVIVTGLDREDHPAFHPDGQIYLFGWENGLSRVDAATGEVERLEWWHRYRRIGGKLVFDQQGTGYIFHPIQPVYRLDLEAETLEMLYHPYGNSWAMSVDPQTEEVYVAYGDRLPAGQTTLFRVGEDGELEALGTIPYGSEESMAFSADGIGYLAVSDGERGHAIYTFNTQEATLKEYMRVEHGVKGLAVDPTTGGLWMVAGDEAVHYNAQGGQQFIPYFERVNNGFLAFGADGTLYTMVWLQREGPNVPMFHGIFRYEGGDWVQLVDMTAKDPGITLAMLAMCPDGHIYVAASIDGADVAPDRPHPSMSSLLRLEQDNELTLIGYDLGYFDPLAIACAPSGALLFTNAQGIYSFPGLGARR